MKKGKAILALILMASLVFTLFVGCGQSEEDYTIDPGESVSTGEDERELVEINFWYLDPMGQMKEAPTVDEVVEQLNAITEEKIGVHVNLEFLTMTEHAQQLSLALAGGERVDGTVLCIVAGSFGNFYSQGYLMDISPYLQQSAPDLYQLVEPYLKAFEMGGGLYGLPVLRLYSTCDVIYFRRDVLEEMDKVAEAENVQSWDDVVAILEDYEQNYKQEGMWAWNGSTQPWWTIFPDGQFEDAIVYDTLGDSLDYIICDTDGKVSASIYNEEFVAGCALAAELTQRGLNYTEPIYSDITLYESLRNGTIFAGLTSTTTAPGLAAELKGSTGVDLVTVALDNGIVTGRSLQQNCVALPVTCEEPEATLKFLNLCYTDTQVMNLITWGIEGKDWVKTETGELDYPDSESATHAYHSMDIMFGNQFLLEPFIGSGADFYRNNETALKAATVSPFLGFSVDAESVEQLIASLSAVKDQYSDYILGGMYTEEDYDEYVAKLQSAGLDDYVDTYQTQLNAWLAGT